MEAMTKLLGRSRAMSVLSANLAQSDCPRQAVSVQVDVDWSKHHGHGRTRDPAVFRERSPKASSVARQFGHATGFVTTGAAVNREDAVCNIEGAVESGLTPEFRHQTAVGDGVASRLSQEG